MIATYTRLRHLTSRLHLRCFPSLSLPAEPTSFYELDLLLSFISPSYTTHAASSARRKTARQRCTHGTFSHNRKLQASIRVHDMYHPPSETTFNLCNGLAAFPASTAQSEPQENVFCRLLEPRLQLIFDSARYFATTDSLHFFYRASSTCHSLIFFFSIFILFTFQLPQHTPTADILTTMKSGTRPLFSDMLMLILYYATAVPTQPVHTIFNF